MSREHGFTHIEMMCLNNLGMYNWNKGNMQKALELFFQALSMYDKAGNEKGSANCLNNIGLIYQELNLPEKALAYHRKAFAIREKYYLEQEQITSLINIGVCLKQLGNIQGAIETYRNGIVLAKKNNNQFEYPVLLQNLANAYQLDHQDSLAIEYYLSALSKSKEYGISTKKNIGIYSGLVVLYNKENRASKALLYAHEALKIIDENPGLERKYPELFLNIAETYYMLDNYAKAREFRDRYMYVQDSLFSEKVAGSIADLEVKYETEKRESQLLGHRAMLAEQQLLVQQKNYIIAGIMVLIIVLGCVGLLLFKHQKLRTKQMQQGHEYKLALSKIESREKLQAQKMSVSRELHDNIGAYTSALLSELQLIKPDEGMDGKSIGDLIYYSRHIMANLRETIWTLSQEKLTLTSLWDRFKDFAQRVANAYPCIRLEFKEHIVADKVLEPAAALHISGILQEAFMNACKHSGADRVMITAYCAGMFRFGVRNNGTGITDKTGSDGFGLENMRERARESGLSLEIINDGGITVVLEEHTTNGVL